MEVLKVKHSSLSVYFKLLILPKGYFCVLNGSKWYFIITYCILCLVQAEITDEVTDILENETNSITFSCQAIGDPVPTISWYFNNVMINESDASKYHVSRSISGIEIASSLTVMNTQSFDAGIYTCEAKNFIGSVRSSGILTINGEYAHVLLNQSCSGHKYLFIYLTVVCICVFVFSSPGH